MNKKSKMVFKIIMGFGITIIIIQLVMIYNKMFNINYR